MPDSSLWVTTLVLCLIVPFVAAGAYWDAMAVR